MLTKLSADERSSRFVATYCNIPADVFYEARGLPRIDELSPLVYPTSVGVLTALTEVMATVAVGDIKLVDLYHNRGNADPLLVACALDAQRSPQSLFEQVWTIVSDDQAVRTKADEFGIEWISSTQFRALLIEGE
ncbi:hypothetical protein [Microbacterium esteraromaticum]|uniref:hypothetical protein n=1 Tax=Microbacterium esteraromaticum TaxID=57043 RepID=UPI0011801F60|nr:hypothetical protein [Microbacterium esteraromaticum]